MQDLIKQSESEFNQKFNILECTIDDTFTIGGEDTIIDWHTKQMELAYEKGRSDERKEIISKITTYAETRLSDYLNDWQASDVVEITKLINSTNII